MWSSVVPSQWVRLWCTSSTNIMFTEYCWPEKLTRVSGPGQSSLRFYSISLSSVSRSADSATNTLVLSWHHMVGLSGMATAEDLTQCTQPHLRQNHTTTRFDIDCSQHKDQTSLCVGPNLLHSHTASWKQKVNSSREEEMSFVRKNTWFWFFSSLLPGGSVKFISTGPQG